MNKKQLKELENMVKKLNDAKVPLVDRHVWIGDRHFYIDKLGKSIEIKEKKL